MFKYHIFEWLAVFAKSAVHPPSGYIAPNEKRAGERNSGLVLDAAVLRAIEVPRNEVVPLEWDAFAQGCGASYLSAYGAVALQLKGTLRVQVRFFEIIEERAGKIAQCAVAIGSEQRIFLDALQLRPEYEFLWKRAMAVLLAELGPGRYKYGSEWSLQPARETTLKTINGVTLDSIKPIIMQAVDFNKWESWDDYWRSVSNNARRNAKRALLSHPDLRIRTRRGLAALADALPLSILRFRVASRKRLGMSFTPILAGYLFRTCVMRRYAMSAVAVGTGQTHAALSGIEFGRHTYYLTGDSTAQNHGAAWHLVLSTIRATYDRTAGDGIFLMGQVLPNESAGWESLARSREQCRVSEFPTSVITFSYS